VLITLLVVTHVQFSSCTSFSTPTASYKAAVPLFTGHQECNRHQRAI